MKRLSLSNVFKMAVICAMMTVSVWSQEQAPAPAGKAAETTKVVAEGKDLEKKEVARMRGKLLYKKGQIRKLEKTAMQSNPQLAKKIDDLERQKRDALIAAEPKLAPLYEEQDKLDEQIRQVTEKMQK